MKRRLGSALALILLACAVPLSAEEAGPGIEDAGWIAGRWIGEGFGGVVEEVWSPPAGGQMVGHFSLVRDGAPVFYEIMLIDRQPDGLRMRVKHFNPDFTGWEARDAWHTFPPRSAAPGDLRFGGISFRRAGEELVIVVRVAENGAPREETLRLRRARHEETGLVDRAVSSPGAPRRAISAE